MSRSLILACVVLLAGCVRDISGNPEYPTDFVVGGVYQSKRPLTARKYFGVDRLALYDATVFPKLTGTPIPTGVSIKVSKVQLERRGLGGKVIWIHGCFVDGPLTNEPVELVYLARPRDSEPRVPVVDTNVLELVKKP